MSDVGFLGPCFAPMLFRCYWEDKRVPAGTLRGTWYQYILFFIGLFPFWNETTEIVESCCKLSSTCLSENA
jgi:hypothetical protein